MKFVYISVLAQLQKEKKKKKKVLDFPVALLTPSRPSPITV